MATSSRQSRGNAISPKALRRCLGKFATGVAVVTTHVDAQDHGITVNSFTSISLEPPLVLWCLARSSRSFDTFVEATHFVINILSVDQVEVSNRFAYRQTDEFPLDAAFTRGTADMPLLDDCAANLQCKKVDAIDGGDHVILIGEVVAIHESDRPGLVYHRGQYAVSDVHPDTARNAGDPRHTGFLESTVRPSLERMTLRFDSLFDGELHDAGIDSRESRVIGLLLSRGGLASEQIANLSLLSGSALGETLESLRQKGLVTSDNGTHGLTEAGASLASSLGEKLREFRSDALGPLDRSEAAELKRMLERLTQWIDAAETAAKE